MTSRSVERKRSSKRKRAPAGGSLGSGTWAVKTRHHNFVSRICGSGGISGISALPNQQVADSKDLEKVRSRPAPPKSYLPKPGSPNSEALFFCVKTSLLADITSDRVARLTQIEVNQMGKVACPPTPLLPSTFATRLVASTQAISSPCAATAAGNTAGLKTA